MKGRRREAGRIRQANRAAAVGRLMLGEIESWDEFVAGGSSGLEDLPRRMLKSGAADVRARLSTDIERFCRTNFVGMAEANLATLYEEVRPPLGLRMPLLEFEERFAKVTESTRRGCPQHATVVLTLWGLAFEFAEHHLSHDLLQHVQWARAAHDELSQHFDRSHSAVRGDRAAIASARKRLLAATRGALLTSFSLVEAYFNSVGWEALQREATEGHLSSKEKKILAGEEGSLRNRIIAVPEIVLRQEIPADYRETASALLDALKPFRDSLTHPSPFSAPEKFGGYDKLSKLYEIDIHHTELMLTLVSALLKKAHETLGGPTSALPAWLEELTDECRWTVERGSGRPGPASS